MPPGGSATGWQDLCVRGRERVSETNGFPATHDIAALLALMLITRSASSRVAKNPWARAG
jgi:hypothetical protein